MLLLAVYIVATSANSLGILWCDCSAHHSHDLCCGSHVHEHGHTAHHDHDDRNGCCDHDHSLCAAFCQTENCGDSFTQHCSCTHRHGESAPFTLSSDTDELLKYIKLFVADAAYSFDTRTDCETTVAAAVFRSRDDVPIVAPPAICAGAPRAPSVEA